MEKSIVSSVNPVANSFPTTISTENPSIIIKNLGVDQIDSHVNTHLNPINPNVGTEQNVVIDKELAGRLDDYSLETIVELKISRFIERLGTYEPEDLHCLIIGKVEKPLIAQVLHRTGGNQVHAARILGINRNTLRKKMKMYGLAV